MSSYAYDAADKESEQRRRAISRKKTPRSPRAERPRRTEPSGPLPGAFQAAGNAALDRLLDPQTHGRPLDPAIRSKLEAAFDADLSQVRVHDDAAASASAGALGATAVTHGQDLQ